MMDCLVVTFSGILTNFPKQKLEILQVQIRKNEIIIEFRKFESVKVPNFLLNKNLNFWIEFAQKEYFRSKTRKLSKQPCDYDIID